MASPSPDDAACHICDGQPGADSLFTSWTGKLMCRDRIACFQRLHNLPIEKEPVK